MSEPITDEDVMAGVYISLAIADAKKTDGKLDDDPVRSPLIRQTLRGHYEKGRKMFVVYADGLVAPETMSLMDEFERKGRLFKRKQTQGGIGGSQRESICFPLREFEDCWAVVHQEPEKVDFVDMCIPIILPLHNEGILSTIPRRTEMSLNSYYLLQVKTELRGNDLIFAIRRDTSPEWLDEYFGPTAFRKDAEPFVWGYTGLKWDAHMCPHDDIAKAGYKVESVDVDYHHPESQVAAEATDEAFSRKRIDQLIYITNAALQHHFELYPNIYNNKRPPQITTLDDLKRYFESFEWSGFDI